MNKFVSNIAMSKRTNQKQRIFELLSSGREVPLPEILKLEIAQYNTRLLELRREGHQILNRTEFKDGKTLSWYRLVSGPSNTRPFCDVCFESRTGASSEPDANSFGQSTESLFGNLAPDRTYQE
ncbi:MAG: hypothetical protein JWQ87_2651 [Candidatus Sulfotelmatobacter sp.]|nr:hypothetical protein [Candidatus Sulfotelmatobacter sp.]